MKKRSSLILGSIALCTTLIFTGCISGKQQTIEIEALKDGSKVYTMKKAKPNIRTKRYRGYKIEDYKLGLIAKDDTITLELAHDLSFTQGTGTPIHYHPFNPPGDVNNPENFSKRRWAQERFWVGFKKLDVEGLKPIKYNKPVYSKNALFDWFTETISTTYNKQDFINFVKTHPQMELKIITQNDKIETNVIGMEYIKKFVACLENENMCKDKEPAQK